MQGIWRVTPKLEVRLLREWPSCGLLKGEVREIGDLLTFAASWY